MQSYKIDMKESQLPVLLTKSIVYNLIQRIGSQRRHISKIEAEALVEMPYIKYLLDVFRSNPEFFAIFKIPPEVCLDAEVIYRLFADQFLMLRMDGDKCFEQVKMLKQDAGIRYFFQCSANFYQVCHSNPEALDLSSFA